MWSRLRRAAEQLSHLAIEARTLQGGRWWRWGSIWFNESFHVVATYRLERSAYLALGDAWPVARVALGPMMFALRPWASRCDIHYRAQIGAGLRVLHPALGVVISGSAITGERLILVGGNCIGLQRAGTIRIGDDVTLGANACVIGPVTIGAGAKLGANALVTRDVGDGETMLAPLAKARREM
jgi:serine O-acetyltransferase